MDVRPGLLRVPEIIHWEHPDFRAMFHRGITPTDIDGWLGFTDLGGQVLVVFEFKHHRASESRGQTKAMAVLRRHLQQSDRFVLVEHAAWRSGHVFPADIVHWESYACGPVTPERDFAEVGDDHSSLCAYVSGLDPFGKAVQLRANGASA